MVFQIRSSEPPTFSTPQRPSGRWTAAPRKVFRLLGDGQSTIHANVRVGRGLRPITQNGRLEITSVRLKLERADGRTIAEAPLDRVSVRKLRWGGFGLALTVDGVKYNVDSPQGIGHTKRLSADVTRFIAIHRDAGGLDAE